MRAVLHRAVVIVTGQGDELATPYFRSHCSGCTQGCEFCEAELANDVPPDGARTFSPPPLPEDERSRLKRQAIYLSALLFGVLAGLLEAFGASPFTNDY